MASGQEDPDVLSSAVYNRGVDVLEFAEAHAQELAAMEKAVRQGPGNHLVAQRVPRHMRRRAAGHNVKRLPRRLQEQAHKEIAKSGGTPKTTKRPSRKHRRRPSNLRQDYERRSRKHVWLETHIWHAKRFHMGALWGYKVPLHPNDKGTRAAYRAAAKHCLLQDLSYMCCIELRGPQTDIIDGLSHLTSSETGLGFGAKKYVFGTREGRTILYSKDQYPHGAVCDVSFMWRPAEGSGVERQLWLWVHPAAHEHAWTALTQAFHTAETQPAGNLSVSMEDDQTKSSQNSQSGAAGTATETSTETVVTSNGADKTVDPPVVIEQKHFSNGRVRMTSLKDTLCRFRLTGPLSQAILAEALTSADISPPGGDTGFTPPPGGDTGIITPPTGGDTDVMSPPGGDTHRWWRQYYEPEESLHCQQEQREAWSRVQSAPSPSQLPPHMLLALTVRDPRLFIPQKRTKATANYATEGVSEIQAAFPPRTCQSALWDASVRQQVKESKMSEQQLNKLRADRLVPGLPLELGASESRVPVLLVQRPGQASSPSAGFAAGWDLILPGGWAMAFWVSLVYRGARAAGLQELHSVALETGRPSFPYQYPDTPAGLLTEESRYEELMSKHLRMPPAKRPNHSKLGVVTPFHHPWLALLHHWAKCSDTSEEQPTSFCVLRSRAALRELQTQCGFRRLQSAAAGKVRRLSETHTSVHDTEATAEQLTVPSSPAACLVPVSVTMVLRGLPAQFSTICVPTTHDLELLYKDRKYGGPLEPLHPDTSKGEKMEKRAKKNGSNKNNSSDKEEGAKEASAAKNEGVQKLSEVVVSSVQAGCSRTLIGYVTAGHFTLSSGQGRGLGYVALQGLQQLLTLKPTNRQATVLIRTNNSLQYRFAHLSVLTD